MQVQSGYQRLGWGRGDQSAAVSAVVREERTITGGRRCAGRPSDSLRMNHQESLRRALTEPVSIGPYDARWARMFVVERDRLQRRFPGRFIEIRHFGSTAVPGLSAKPVIDLIAGLPTMLGVDELIADLQGFGYDYHLAGNEAGSGRRWLLRHKDGHRTHHLHLVQHGARLWQERVGFCERLQADPQLRARYMALKKELAAKFADQRDEYTAKKEKFILAAIAPLAVGSRR